MDATTAAIFLKEVLGRTVFHVSAVNDGEVSKAFGYVNQGKDFLIRFSTKTEYQELQRMIYELLSPYGVLIPLPVEMEPVEGLNYFMVEEACGRPVSSFSSDVITGILDSIVDQLAKMNKLTVETHHGYGPVLSSGNGRHESWEEFLETFFRDEHACVWNGWCELFECSFLERELCERYFSMMMRLVRYTPEERHLVHGDFHVGNILTDGTQVTAIVDWEMAMYGDFMVDVAAFHFWRPDLNFPLLVRQAWQRDNESIPDCEERLTCALIFKGLDALRVCAQQNNRSRYEWIKYQLNEFTKSMP